MTRDSLSGVNPHHFSAVDSSSLAAKVWPWLLMTGKPNLSTMNRAQRRAAGYRRHRRLPAVCNRRQLRPSMIVYYVW